ncbi:hypothetical protein P3L10_026502 [Capsicum annuum]
MKAPLKHKAGLARRIFTKIGLDNTLVLQEANNFISRQPKNTKKYKKEMWDFFVSVEHILLVSFSDKRFSQKLFRNLQLTEKALMDAFNVVR